MSYATPGDLIKRFDVRLLGDLAQDANTRLDAASLATDANVLAALADASGIIESACFVGNRYLSSDLSALPTNSEALLIRLTCDIAVVLLCNRRGMSYKDKFPLIEESYKLLDRLRLGERVFDIDDNEDKGNPTSDVITMAKIEEQNLLSMHSRYFKERMPIFGQ